MARNWWTSGITIYNITEHNPDLTVMLVQRKVEPNMNRQLIAYILFVARENGFY